MSITYTVTQINNNIDNLINKNFVNIYIEGEISSMKISPSGHVYFTLKDESSELSCVMFKNDYNQSTAKLKTGDYILSLGSLGLYKPKGQFQFKVFQIKPKGQGTFWEKFERLKIKLSNEGLFDADKKKQIPKFIKTIVIVTSLNGVVKDDIIKIARDRCKYQRIIIYPVSVQGANAAPEISNAIKIINRDIQTDVIIISRGGGSIEDLWPFNEEVLAREVFASKIPVISAVGHETDYTICDFVSDKRASTPSDAGKLISINQSEVLQYLDELLSHMNNTIQKHIEYNKETLFTLINKKIILDPLESIKVIKNNIFEINTLLNLSIDKNFSKIEATIDLFKSNFKNMNPYNVLNRGYSLLLNDQRKTVSSIKRTDIGNHLYSVLSDGELKLEVVEKNEKDKNKK